MWQLQRCRTLERLVLARPSSRRLLFLCCLSRQRRALHPVRILKLTFRSGLPVAQRAGEVRAVVTAPQFHCMIRLCESRIYRRCLVVVWEPSVPCDICHILSFLCRKPRVLFRHLRRRLRVGYCFLWCSRFALPSSR